MSERLRIIKGGLTIIGPSKKRLEIIKVSDETPLSKIEPIEQGGISPEGREGLASLVEAPLLEACQTLFDKKIRTIFSSANKKDLDTGKVYITIDYGSLRPRNKEIAKNCGGEIHMTHGSTPSEAINLEIPVNESTTVGQIRKATLELVSRFEQQ